MRGTPIAFRYTSEMWAWYEANRQYIAGECSVFDTWTYGHCFFRPVITGQPYWSTKN